MYEEVIEIKPEFVLHAPLSSRREKAPIAERVGVQRWDAGVPVPGFRLPA